MFINPQTIWLGYIGAIIIALMMFFGMSQDARAFMEDSKWQERVGTYLETAWAEGRDILINGLDHYLNFGFTSGESGYGFRDNSGDIEYKDSGGSWIAINSISGGGGGSGDAITVDGTAVDTTGAFASSGDIDFIISDGGAGGPDTITADYNTGSIVFTDLDNTDITLADFTNDAGFITSTLSQEQVEDYAGGMWSGNTETGGTITYQDIDGTLDFVLDATGDWTGTLDGYEAAALLDDTTLSDEQVQDKAGAMWSGNTETGATVTYQDADGTIDIVTDVQTSDLHNAVTLSGVYDYITLSGQDIVRGQIDLTTDVTGTLLVGSGGTGTATQFTTGSVVFAGASGVYSQDNANLFWDNSNNRLGIGTTAPGAKLHIDGNSISEIAILNSDNANGGYLTFKDNGTTRGFVGHGSTLFASLANTDFGIRSQAGMAFGDTGAVNMYIDIAGNVGIGTSAPVNKLDVEGGIAIGASYSGTNTAPSNGAIIQGNVGIGTTSPSSTAGSDTVLQVFNTVDAGLNIKTNNAEWEFKNVNPNGDLTLFKDGSNRITFKNGGNVGIGTSAPVNKLDVEGGIAIGASYSGTNTAPSNGAIIQGNVGIGTTSPNQKLTVEGTFSLKEQASANADTAAYGQLWVKNDTPNTLMFTDDAGNDHDLTAAGGAETNSLETTITGILDTEIFIGNGANSGTFASISGDATLANTGALSLAANSVADNEIDYSAVTLNDLTFDVGSVSKTEFGYLNGVTSAIQTQIDALFDTAGDFITSSGTTLDIDAEIYTDTKCLYFEDPTADDDFNSIWRNSSAKSYTLTEIWCESDQTVNLDLQVDDGTPADVNGSDLACTSSEAEDTTLSGDTTLAANEELDLAITSVSGTPTWVSVCWTYQKVD